MTDAELLAQLAPPLAPTAPSWWPLAMGWWVLISLIFLLLAIGLWRLGKRWPWWRWPKVWRARKRFLAALPTPLQPGHALNQWIRVLGREGMNLPTTLSTREFVQALNQHRATPLPDDLTTVMDAAYQPRPDNMSLATPLPQLMRTLCHTCLTLHSPGLG